MANSKLGRLLGVACNIQGQQASHIVNCHSVPSAAAHKCGQKLLGYSFRKRLVNSWQMQCYFQCCLARSQLCRQTHKL